MKSPDAFRTISEVSKETKIPTHVLRFWESKFSNIKPLKRSGNRRYYRPEDVKLIIQIKTLLYDNGYTVYMVCYIQNIYYICDRCTLICTILTMIHL